ncbi:hypothetical protein U9M48_012452 [Paspalum notatum var. saurae]|uniref:Uncharacterized protein n=1 Tax=Paspalum notatum var. saurae TaxID=547442 RepID=A0AAQ3WIE7_PASNO
MASRPCGLTPPRPRQSPPLDCRAAARSRRPGLRATAPPNHPIRSTPAALAPDPRRPGASPLPRSTSPGRPTDAAPGTPTAASAPATRLPQPRATRAGAPRPLCRRRARPAHRVLRAADAPATAASPARRSPADSAPPPRPPQPRRVPAAYTPAAATTVSHARHRHDRRGPSTRLRGDNSVVPPPRRGPPPKLQHKLQKCAREKITADSYWTIQGHCKDNAGFSVKSHQHIDCQLFKPP